jgi:hypothetical protein
VRAQVQALVPVPALEQVQVLAPEQAGVAEAGSAR